MRWLDSIAIFQACSCLTHILRAAIARVHIGCCSKAIFWDVPSGRVSLLVLMPLLSRQHLMVRVGGRTRYQSARLIVLRGCYGGFGSRSINSLLLINIPNICHDLSFCASLSMKLNALDSCMLSSRLFYISLLTSGSILKGCTPGKSGHFLLGCRSWLRIVGCNHEVAILLELQATKGRLSLLFGISL